LIKVALLQLIILKLSEVPIPFIVQLINLKWDLVLVMYTPLPEDALITRSLKIYGSNSVPFPPDTPFVALNPESLDIDIPFLKVIELPKGMSSEPDEMLGWKDRIIRARIIRFDDTLKSRIDLMIPHFISSPLITLPTRNVSGS
jgi:hypothetical protein